MDEYHKIKQWRLPSGRFVSGEEVTDIIIDTVLFAIRRSKDKNETIRKALSEETIEKLWMVITKEHPHKADVGRTLAKLRTTLAYSGYLEEEEKRENIVGFMCEIAETVMRHA